jgi:hypothetical protein
LIGLAEGDALGEVGSAERFVGVGKLKLRPRQLVRAVEEEPVLEGLRYGERLARGTDRCAAMSAPRTMPNTEISIDTYSSQSINPVMPPSASTMMCPPLLSLLSGKVSSSSTL